PTIAHKQVVAEMDVRGRTKRAGRADEGVVVDQYAGGIVEQFEGAGGGVVVGKIAIDIGRAAKDGLGAESQLGGIGAAVFERAHIVHPAVEFDAVVGDVEHVFA